MHVTKSTFWALSTVSSPASEKARHGSGCFRRFDGLAKAGPSRLGRAMYEMHVRLLGSVGCGRVARHMIIRLSWVFGGSGDAVFLRGAFAHFFGVAAAKASTNCCYMLQHVILLRTRRGHGNVAQGGRSPTGSPRMAQTALPVTCGIRPQSKSTALRGIQG